MLRVVREFIRLPVIKLRYVYLRLWGYYLHNTTRISYSAFLDKTNPKGIDIGKFTLIATEAMVLSHVQPLFTRTNFCGGLQH